MTEMSMEDWDGIGPVTRMDAGTAVRLSRNEQVIVRDLAGDLRAVNAENDHRANGATLDRLLAKGFEPGTLLYIGFMIDATGETDPDALALALATRSPNAFPSRIRRYVRRFQAHWRELVEDEDRADEREELAMLRDHFGPDPELFDE